MDTYFKQNEEEELWKITTKSEMEDTVRLHSIGFDLPLKKIYWQVPELQGEEWDA